MIDQLPVMESAAISSYRLIPSCYPPVSLFDDVVSADEFEYLYELQALTNPRIQNDLGNLQLIGLNEIPFGIPGCNYATSAFTHVNENGSRFSDGRYGVLYTADSMATALEEVAHHQALYWKLAHLEYDRLTFRGLRCEFDETGFVDATSVPMTDPIYRPDDYSVSRALGAALKAQKVPGLRYCSVRQHEGLCWALMTPAVVSSIVQAAHYEMIWKNNRIAGVNKVSMI